MLGSKSYKLGRMGGLASFLEKPSLSADMVKKFTPVILDYVKEEGKHAMNLIQGGFALIFESIVLSKRLIARDMK